MSVSGLYLLVRCGLYIFLLYVEWSQAPREREREREIMCAYVHRWCVSMVCGETVSD